MHVCSTLVLMPVSEKPHLCLMGPVAEGVTDDHRGCTLHSLRQASPGAFPDRVLAPLSLLSVFCRSTHHFHTQAAITELSALRERIVEAGEENLRATFEDLAKVGHCPGPRQRLGRR